MDDQIEVIIPSLGKKVLNETIEKLNNGSIRPKNIICVIYNNKKFVPKKNYKNLKFFYTHTKGQVSQRLIAFKKTKEKFILQIDDDIIIDFDCLKNLLISIKKLGKGNVVGPVYKSFQNKPIHVIKKNKFQIVFDLYNFLICNSKFGIKKSGTLSQIFLAYGIDPKLKYKDRLIKTDWLPGGCLLTYRSDFISNPRYPFSGKAYCEDVFYSIIRNKRHISHFVDLDSKVKTSYKAPNLKSFFGEFKVRFFLVKKFKKIKILRFFLWALFDFFRRILIKI